MHTREYEHLSVLTLNSLYKLYIRLPLYGIACTEELVGYEERANGTAVCGERDVRGAVPGALLVCAEHLEESRNMSW